MPAGAARTASGRSKKTLVEAKDALQDALSVISTQGNETVQNDEHNDEVVQLRLAVRKSGLNVANKIFKNIGEPIYNEGQLEQLRMAIELYNAMRYY